jgi:hypothetical protein
MLDEFQKARFTVVRVTESPWGNLETASGNATHQADNFLRMEGLLAIDDYSLYNVEAVHRLKAKIEGRIALFPCDFTPVGYEGYFREMPDRISCRGLIVDSRYSPATGPLKGGSTASSGAI